MEISLDFCGANAKILDVSDTEVQFQPDLRDTEGDWFYWAFAVKGAAGKTIKFSMKPKEYIGYFGAAVSTDLINWRWSNTAESDFTGFTYTFGANENFVYFAHDMLYHPSRFYHFAELHRMPIRITCNDNKGTPIPYLTVGNGNYNIVLTARHHCCESTGDYIMEGMICEFINDPIPDFRVTAIPFIDADGTVNGDQGKNRRPHDHYLDYGMEPLYNGVRAIKELLDIGDVKYIFDLHSPWHQTGRNDKLFFVRNPTEKGDSFIQMGRLFEEENNPGSMIYNTENDISLGVDWYTSESSGSCVVHSGNRKSVELALVLETTYFGEPGNVVSQEKLIESGRSLMRAIRKYNTAKHRC